MRILIVDDSVVYRSKIKAALSGISWIEIVGAASNGKIALEMLEQKSVDLVTLDMEMPTMDGLQTLKELRKKDKKTKVIVFSSSTYRGSEATLDALNSGADDFVAKPASDGAEGGKEMTPEESIKRDLLPKIEQFREHEPITASVPARTVVPPSSLFPSKDLATFRPSAVVIASSTGGPAAHDFLFKGLGGALRCPILIAQHMPPLFTTTFAKRISEYSGLPCREAVHGEPVKEAIYVAPGDFHLSVKKNGEVPILSLDKQPLRNFVRPAADYLFETAAEVYGSRCMGFVLTGMGEDGLIGAKAVKNRGGGIMIQDEKSCVVFGMPGAVFLAKAFDAMGSLEEIKEKLKRMALR